MSVVIVYGSGMFCDNQCQDDNGAGIIADVQIKWQNLEPIWKSIMTIHLIRYCIKKFPDVTNRLRNRQDISSTDFLMERNCIFQVLTTKEQVLPAHIRKTKMDLNLNEARWY